MNMHTGRSSFWITLLTSLAILTLSLFVAKSFIYPFCWAGIIAISTWPLYRYFSLLFGRHQNWSAFLFTTLLTLVLILPLFWVIMTLTQEAYIFLMHVNEVNQQGLLKPDWLIRLPVIGERASQVWDTTLAHPHGVSELIRTYLPLDSLTEWMKFFSVQVFHRMMKFSLTIVLLFFFYRDGPQILEQIHHKGLQLWSYRWEHYRSSVSNGIRGAVNGVVIVGIAVGFLMGFSYSLAGIPMAALLGFVTALLSLIPFGMGIIIVICSVVLFAQGSVAPAIALLVWGSLVNFVCDHMVKPLLIGNTTRMPFLGIFIGVIGGMELFGLLGLFLGPIVMVLFFSLWEETLEMPSIPSND